MTPRDLTATPEMSTAGPSQADENGATGGDTGETPRARPATPRRRRWRLLSVGAVLVGAFCFLIVKGLSGSLDYFETVDQAVAQKAMLGSRDFRLEGLVLPGTVHRTKNGVTFVAGGTHHRLFVINTGNPPELFQPDIPVVVVGHFSGQTFVSNQIIVDHSSQYIEEYPKRVEAPNGTTR